MLATADIEPVKAEGDTGLPQPWHHQMRTTRPPLFAWPNTRNSPLLILVTGVIFSFGPLIFRSTSGKSDAWQYLVYRFLSLSIAGSTWMLLTIQCWPLRLTLQRAWRSALGGALMAGCNVCFIVALERIDSATTLLLQSLAPFSAALLSWLVRRERIDGHTCCCMVLAVAGVAIMGSEWDASDPLGLAAAAGIAVLLGAYAVVLRGKAQMAPEPRLQLVLNGLFGLGLSAAAVISSRSVSALGIPARDVMCAMAAGGLCLGLGIPLYQACGKHVNPARTTLLLLSEVVLAPIWTLAFAGEVPTARTVAGGVVLVCAIVWLTMHPEQGADERVYAQKPTAMVHRDDDIARRATQHNGSSISLDTR